MRMINLPVKRLLQFGVMVFPVVALVILMMISRPHYAAYFLKELSPLSWFHSVFLYTIALAGLWLMCHYLQNNNRIALLWGGWSFAFGGLMLDERFAIHERLRDSALHQISVPWLWVAPGDYVLLVAFLLSIGYVWLLLGCGELHRDSKRWLCVGLLATSVAIGLDSLNIHALSIDWLQRIQVVEEFFETIAMGLFLNACIEQGWAIHLHKHAHGQGN